MKPIEDKNFLYFLGKPLIQHQLEMLKKSGFKDLVIVGGKHNMDKIQALGKSLGMKMQVVEQEELDLGMCGAVLAAKKFIKGQDILVVSTNDIVDPMAYDLMKKAIAKKDVDGYLIGKKVKNYFPGGYLEVDKSARIKNIVEKPGAGKEPSDLINLVIHYHRRADTLIKYLEKSKSKNDDLYEIALAVMLKDGVKMRAVRYDGYWQALKFPWHVQKAFRHFMSKEKRRISKKAKIAKSAVIEGDVIIEDGAKIFDGAFIKGPAYIGKDTIVATNSLVRESHIGERSIVGFSTEVARSYVGNDVWTHTNYIGDSVIGNNVAFGAGAVTGNLRLDEKNIYVLDHEGNKIDTQMNKFGLITGDNVRIGVNASMMPGIKVGSNSFVGAGIVVGENIPENSFARGEWKLKITPNKEKLNPKARENFILNLKQP